MRRDTVKKVFIHVSLLGTVLLSQNCGNSFQVHESEGLQALSSSSTPVECTSGTTQVGYLMSSALQPQLCGGLLTKNCINGQWDRSEQLVPTCQQLCRHPVTNEAAAPGITYTSYSVAQAPTQELCNAARIQSSCSQTTGLFSPAPGQHAACLVQGQICAYANGPGLAVPSGNMTGATVAGYTAQSATSPTLCGNQVTRTCQASGSWNGSTPLYTTCEQRCLHPDSNQPVTQNTVYTYFTRQSGTQSECAAARVTSTCQSSTGLFSPAVAQARFLSCAIVAPPPPVTSGYDLGAAIARVPFNVMLPAAPAITSEVVCTNEAEITASLGVNGRRTIIAPGNYRFESITVTGNNKHIVFQPGANMTLASFSLSNAQRIWVEGAVLTTSGPWGFPVSAVQDIRIERMTLNALDSAFIIYTSTPANQRILLLSSSITAALTGGGTGAYSDFIVANSEIISNRPEGTNNGWAMRWWEEGSTPPHVRTVFMDSRFRALQNVVVRFEASQENGYFARNQIEGNNPFRTEGRESATPSAYPLNGLWFIDNYLYPLTGGNGAVIVTGFPRTSNLTATGNRTVGPSSATNAGFLTGQATWTTQDNAHILTNGYQAPPVWRMR